MINCFHAIFILQSLAEVLLVLKKMNALLSEKAPYAEIENAWEKLLPWNIEITPYKIREAWNYIVVKLCKRKFNLRIQSKLRDLMQIFKGDLYGQRLVR